MSQASQHHAFFNQDIIYLVLDNLYFEDKHHLPNNTTLKHCSLISRAWRLPAQRLLFHQVTIVTEDQYNRIKNAVAISPTLAACVRILDYTITSGAIGIPRGQRLLGASWESRLGPVMSLFPQLYELRLTLTGLNTIKLSTKILRQLESTPKIKALQVGHRDATVNSVIPLQLLHVANWPLEFIVFRGQAFHYAKFVDFPPVKHQFYEIRSLFTGAYGTEQYKGFLTYVGGNSDKTIEAMHVSNIHDIPDNFGPRLQSLTVANCTDQNWNIEIASFKALKELVVTTAYHFYAIDIYRNIPPKIVHLGLTFYRATKQDLKLLFAQMPNSASISLRQFSLFATDSIRQDNDFKPYEFKALLPNAQVCVYAGHSKVRVRTRADLIKAVSPTGYPRGVTVENMHRRRLFMTDGQQLDGAPKSQIHKFSSMFTKRDKQQPSEPHIEETKVGA